MSEVRVRWTQSVAGRVEGYEETVELTDFILGCAANNRLIMLPEPAPEPVVEAPKPRPLRRISSTEAAAGEAIEDQ